MKYSKEQKQVIEYTGRFQQVVAGAGSGKTFTMIQLLVKLVRDGLEKQKEILVITFSKKAVAEIEERLTKAVGQHDIQVKTFHAYCLYILKKYHPVYSQKGVEIILPEDREKIFRQFFREKKYIIGGIPFEFFLQTNSDFLATYFPQLKPEIEKIYSDYKQERNRIDFDDMVSLYLQGMRTQKEWAMQAKKEVKRVIVDEFQDTDMTQLEWLQLLQPEKLTVVGDDWQAIYGFRGASTIPFLKFKEFFQPCQVNFLCANYRSLAGIVKISALPIGKNKNNIKKKTTPFREGKAKIYRLPLTDRDDFRFFVQSLLENEEFLANSIILCRSNFRIAEYQQAKIPEKNLMTIHGSKGLEFPYVIVDLAGGWNVTIHQPRETIEEERRILYVALSRAQNHLLILGNRKPDKEKLEDRFFRYFRWRVASIRPEKLDEFFG